MVRKLGMAALAASAIAIVSTANVGWAADKPVFGLVMSFSGWVAPGDAGTLAGAEAAGVGADGAVDVIGKGAKAILFPSDFDFGAPGAYVAQQKDVIAFSGASDPKFGVQGVGPLAYSTSNASQAQGALLAEWAYKQKGWKNAYVLLDNTIAYTKSLCASFATRWTELAGKEGLLGQDTFLNNDPSIAAQVTRITGLPKKPDLVFFCSYAPGGPSAIRQIRAAGIDAAIVTGESLDGDYWIGSVPDLSNFYVISYGSKYGDDPDAEVNGFFKRFEAKYNKKADVSYGLRGYAPVQAFANYAQQAGSLDGAKVAAALDTFDKKSLVIGPTTYTPKLHIQTTPPMAILQETQRQIASIGRFSVEKFPPLQ